MASEEKLRQVMRIKIISMGDAEVGKSCLIKKFCERKSVVSYIPTVGIDYGVTKTTVNGQLVKVNIFDMAGHPLFYEVRNEFYRDAQGAILVYDVSLRTSFHNLQNWLDEMRKEIGSQVDADSLVVFVCANKTDVGRRQVDHLEGRLWAESFGFEYFETSAQTGVNVQEMFESLFKTVVERISSGKRYEKRASNAAFTRQLADAIRQLLHSSDNCDKLGLPPNPSKEEINKAYHRLARLLHPDKNVVPGGEEAFKVLVGAKSALLKSARS